MYNTSSLTRAELKACAKETLKGNFWYAVVFSLLFSVIAMAVQSVSQIFTGEETSLGVALLGLVISLALSFFVTIPLSVGHIRFYINIAKGNAPQVNDLFYVYKNGLLNTVVVTFFEGLFIYLWSLLFVIPGIIKSYQYMMIDYMLAENPNLDRKRAFEITKATMNGDKMKAFVLGLSFIGWALLCIVTFGIGVLFLTPYINSTMAHYYLELKEKAVAIGAIQPGELAD